MPGAVDHVLAGVDRDGCVTDIVEDRGDREVLGVRPEYRRETLGLLKDSTGVCPARREIREQRFGRPVGSPQIHRPRLGEDVAPARAVTWRCAR